MTSVATLTRADYEAVWEIERQHVYPVIDAFEAECGYALDRERLESAARVLACPVKKNPPCWQHGRVLYSLTRRHIDEKTGDDPINVLDIGTAKGFSALCLLWALEDAGHAGSAGLMHMRYFGLASVDVIDPLARVSRNTVAEVDGLKTLAETLSAWPEASQIHFVQSTGIDWLTAHKGRVHVAFIDGKHSGHVVLQEGKLLAARQHQGDLAIFDDVHIPDVSTAVNCLLDRYRLRYIEVLPNRHYAIGVRR